MSRLEKICSEISELKGRINNLKPAKVKVTVDHGDQHISWSGTATWVGSGTVPAIYTTAGNNTYMTTLNGDVYTYTNSSS